MGQGISFTATVLTVLRMAIEEEARLWSRLAPRDSDHGEEEVQAACQRLANEYRTLLQKLGAAQSETPVVDGADHCLRSWRL